MQLHQSQGKAGCEEAIINKGKQEKKKAEV